MRIKEADTRKENLVYHISAFRRTTHFASEESLKNNKENYPNYS